ncbi:MAG: BatD family protein [Gammaproteobacteria bacterium]|nr:BatD family protein [Gammaproteobacteria bacterium]
MSVRRALSAFVLATISHAAWAATLSLSVETEAIHAGMPFTLSLSAKGFEEEPPPEPPDLAIEGCEVTYLGVSPSVRSSVQIINGRRSEWREVTFVYRWRVLAPTAGSYTIPPLRVEQAGVEANSRAASFAATDVPATDDMIVRMTLPDRPLWVGETFEASVDWLLSREARDYEFAVPLFNLDGAEVTPDASRRGDRQVAFGAGAGQVELPLIQSSVEEGGKEYTGVTFPARVTLNRPGVVDLAPVRVVARLRSGTTRDSWGFRRASYGLFRAQGEPRRLTVRPLPLAGRPPTFVNAIGGGYAIDVQASRTVVSVGEPVELTVRLRGDGPLTGLSLPPLGGPGGLPETHFSVPEGSVAGEVDEETNSKRFTFTVRVKSADVGEIPPIAFSYFDPALGDYRSVTSEPVALSVGTAQMVGVADVVAAPALAKASAREERPGVGGAIATLVGADMSLSPPNTTLAVPWGSDGSRLLLVALYGTPLIAALVAFAFVRSGGRRTRNRTVRQALRALERALDARQPARQAAPGIVAAMRRLADVSGNDPRETSGIVERLETRAFDPAAADQTVPVEIAAELRRVGREWARRPGIPGQAAAKASAAVVALAVVGLLVTSRESEANEGAQTAIEGARGLYRSAIEESDRLRRVRLFAGAERAFRSEAAANVDAPELQVDWGNAALGAQDAGRAVLAYRRALSAAPDNGRALTNLAWVRDRLPVWVPRPAADGALDSLLFWRDRFSVPQLHVLGGAAFAIGVLLLTPWPRRPRWLGAVAVGAFAVWIVAAGSAVLAADAADDAVVVTDGVTLRSADSTGASPTFANPLPAGTEVGIVETRDAWVRVALADGTRGWLAASSVEAVRTLKRPDATTPASA